MTYRRIIQSRAAIITHKRMIAEHIGMALAMPRKYLNHRSRPTHHLTSQELEKSWRMNNCCIRIPKYKAPNHSNQRPRCIVSIPRPLPHPFNQSLSALCPSQASPLRHFASRASKRLRSSGRLLELTIRHVSKNSIKNPGDRLHAYHLTGRVYFAVRFCGTQAQKFLVARAATRREWSFFLFLFLWWWAGAVVLAAVLTAILRGVVEWATKVLVAVELDLFVACSQALTVSWDASGVIKRLKVDISDDGNDACDRPADGVEKHAQWQAGKEAAELPLLK